MLVMGPWYHARWWFEPATSLGDIAFGSETATFFHDNIELPFYNCLLKQRARSRCRRHGSSRPASTNGIRSTHGPRWTPRQRRSTWGATAT
jgi:hypothetical protein